MKILVVYRTSHINVDLGSLSNLKLSTLTGWVKYLFPFSISAALTGQNTEPIIYTQHIIHFPVTSAPTWTKFGHDKDGDNVFSRTVPTNLSYYTVQKHQNNDHFNYIHHHNLKTLMFHSSYIKKVKFTLEQAMKVQKGSRSIALLFL
jgi:hypothetical protein